MTDTRTPLYEFMPYGAPELLEAESRHVQRAMTVAMLGVVTLFAAVTLALRVLPHSAIEGPGPLLPPIHAFQPPPSIADAPLPQARVSPPSATQSAAVPVPVSDAQANPTQTIPSQADLSQAGPATDTHAGEGGTAVAPPEDLLPGLNDWHVVDELPVLVTSPPPVYPDIAREAGIDGTVRLRVLVGRDGHVLDVHVDRSVAMLDQAAQDAVRRWVFKPALTNGRPVAVWVAIPVRFTLH